MLGVQPALSRTGLGIEHVSDGPPQRDNAMTLASFHGTYDDQTYPRTVAQAKIARFWDDKRRSTKTTIIGEEIATRSSSLELSAIQSDREVNKTNYVGEREIEGKIATRRSSSELSAPESAQEVNRKKSICELEIESETVTVWSSTTSRVNTESTTRSLPASVRLQCGARVQS